MVARLLTAIGGFVESERAILRSTLLSLIVRIAGLLASFLVGVVLARRLSPAGFGIYGIVLAVALVLSVFAQLGLPTLATRQISVALSQKQLELVPGYIRWYSWIVLLFSILCSGLWLSVVVLFPDLLGPQLVNVLGVLLVPLFALTVLISAELRALDKIVSGQAFEILIRPTLTCVFLSMVLMFAGRLTAPIAIAVNVAASAATLLFAVLWLASTVPRRPPIAYTQGFRPKRWLAPALSLAAFDVLRQIDATYGILLLGAFSSDSEAGYLRVALSTILVVATPLSIFNVVLAPALARAHSECDMPRLQRILNLSSLAMFAAASAALFVVLVVGKPLISLIFGKNYAPAWAPLLLLTCAQAINGFFGVGAVLLSMSGGERKLTASFTVSITASVAAAVPLTVAWGARGAAAAAVIGALIQNMLIWWSVRKHCSLDSSAAAFLRSAQPTSVRKPR